MNTIVKTLLLAILLSILFVTCKSTDPLVKQQKIEAMDNKIESRDYTFEAKMAQPMNGRTIHLTSLYTLEVKPDSIIAHLPYFGRAYSAPSSTEIGIKFVSTNFDYEVTEKKKGVQSVSIKIKDHSNGYNLSMLIGELGKTTVYVSQTNKQSITFVGDIY